MAKEKRNDDERNWDENLEDAEARYVRDSADTYLKFAKKNSEATFFAGRPMNSINGIIARGVIDFVTDRLAIDMTEVSSVERRDIANIAEEIVSQGIADTVAQSFYEKIEVLPPETKTPEQKYGRLAGMMGNLHAAMGDFSRQRQADEINEAMNVAIEWGEREELTPLERCHGVAHTLYQVYGMDSITGPDGETIVVDPARSYAKSYDFEYESKIKDRSMRAAKELFGGGNGR